MLCKFPQSLMTCRRYIGCGTMPAKCSFQLRIFRQRTVFVKFQRCLPKYEKFTSHYRDDTKNCLCRGAVQKRRLRRIRVHRKMLKIFYRLLQYVMCSNFSHCTRSLKNRLRYDQTSTSQGLGNQRKIPSWWIEQLCLRLLSWTEVARRRADGHRSTRRAVESNSRCAVVC